ncbi:hypothetical protein FHS27_006344 [Rhodopirellula rubra]|uniref:Secreted protein n=1 Tax=Aporhodopirellula rubra TaxID=980271 RepID=A0A7W5E736_9BACT|nr:hypothetical protein [Aporhodopirellula rubra]MBB3210497.1 hypothetical protein [Aporhodopirellula rubra]
MTRFVFFSALSLAFFLSVGCADKGASSSLDGASEQEIADMRATIEEEQRRMANDMAGGDRDINNLPKE